MSDLARVHDPEALLEHAEWVRDLAARLLGDPHQGEDAAQDTWVAVLEHPPSTNAPGRGWLGRVTRNFALRRRRAESRRAHWEAQHPGATHAPSTQELAERADALRKVVEALVQLEEPFRAVLLLRYFEGLEPQQIAERLQIPAATVRTRQHRAMERLRDRLRQAYGGDWQALCLLLVPAVDATTTYVPARTFPLTLKLAVMSVFLLPLLLLLNHGRSAPTEVAASTPAERLEAFRPAAEVEGFLPVVPPVRDQPAGALVAPQEPSGPIQIKVRYQTPDGRRLGEALAMDPPLRLTELCAIATLEPPGSSVPLVDTMAPTRFGYGRYRSGFDLAMQENAPKFDPDEYDGILELQTALPVLVSAVYRTVVLETVAVESAETVLVFTIDPQRIVALLASVQLRVVDAVTQQPLPGWINLDSSDQASFELMSSPDGTKSFSQYPPGRLRLEINARGYERYTQLLDLAPGSQRDLGTILLSPAIHIRGRVQNEAGEPLRCDLSAVNLSRLNLPQALWDRFGLSSQPDGSFDDAVAGRGPMLLLPNPGTEYAADPVLVDTSGGDRSGVVVVLHPGTEVILNSELSPVQAAIVTIRRADGIPCWAERLNGPREARLRLLPGSYTLELAVDSGVISRASLTVAQDPVTVPIAFP